jgi:ribosome-binding protein aMBF1 (putative translation factor)
MKKTICDICGKEMDTSIFTESIRDSKFCISRYGVIMDICNDCREELGRWIGEMRKKNEC